MVEDFAFFLHFISFSHFGHLPDTLCDCDTNNNITKSFNQSNNQNDKTSALVLYSILLMHLLMQLTALKSFQCSYQLCVQ